MFTVLILVAVFISGSLLLAPPATAQSITVQGRLVDDQGSPVADATILAIQKTWPNNRYRQRALRTTTDQQGNFEFARFAQSGKQYAFLLTVVSDEWLMTSVYRVVRDGAQQDRVTLETAPAEPVSLSFRDASGKPVSSARALPTRLTTKDGVEHLSYSQQIRASGVAADENGDVRFGAWKPGEKAAIVYSVGNAVKTLEFTVPDNRQVSVVVDTSRPRTQPVHVAGQVVDSAGKPVADVPVLAIQKTWPNNRYRQNALTTKTDANGKFQFENFAIRGRQYAYLLTALGDGYAMTSHYELVRDGAQKSPTTLKVETAEPVTFVFNGADGKPLSGVQVCPSGRTSSDSQEYLIYSMHMDSCGKTSDDQGQVTFTAWKPGDSGSFHYRYNDKYGELKFTVGPNRMVTIAVP